MGRGKREGRGGIEEWSEGVREGMREERNERE